MHTSRISCRWWVAVIAALALAALLQGCSAKRQPLPAEQRPASRYDAKSKLVDGHDLDRFSDSQLRVWVAARVNMPPEKAFRMMAVDLHLWFPGVKRFTWNHAHSQRPGEFGPGSVRTGVYKGDRMVEKVLLWYPPRYYVYRIDLDATEAFIPINGHLGIFTVEADGQGGSFITWRQYFHPSVPLTGSLVAWVMEGVAEEAFDNLTATFGGNRFEGP